MAEEYNQTFVLILRVAGAHADYLKCPGIITQMQAATEFFASSF